MNKRLKNIFKALVLTIALAGGQNAAFAQTAKRIGFAAGKSSAVVKGTGNQSYIVTVGAGRTCRIRLVSPRNSATLEALDASGMDLTEGGDGRSFEGAFGESVELKINVAAGGKTAFTLNVTVK